ncbi:fungal-specific transcription factor domain-containing protein [Aspergillus karnatakaensis]|uniref:Zn(II)2Cys6 transcription factor n=1 Tax=Aspergillus karnatakaensis TaxID=1810916 RepID=UPI003CCE2227
MPPSRPKRTHSFGGCKACRTRHLKCDQTAPTCNRCRISGLKCDFSSVLRWMVLTGAEVYDSVPQVAGSEEERSSRRYLYSESARQAMSRSLTEGVCSVTKALDDLDERSKCLHQGNPEMAFGPFSVFTLASSNNTEVGIGSQEIVDNIAFPQQRCTTAYCGSESIATARSTSPSQRHPPSLTDGLTDHHRSFNEHHFLEDLLASPIDLLQWGDLFAQPDSSFPHTPDAAVMGSSIWPEERCLQPSLSQDPYWPQLDLISEAPVLLRHFNDEVIDQMGSLPINEKSTWRTLSFPLALVTLSDLTVLHKSRSEIKHANIANFYALIAVSAFHLALNSVAFPALERGENYWSDLSSHTYAAAKRHLHESLQNECSLPRKAKYKEQLIAIGAILATAILSGNEIDTRQYLTEMEHLIRWRGLKKPAVSRRARSLHNVYAWMRIVSESTNVAYNQRVMPSTRPLSTMNSHPNNTIKSDIALDNFLHLQPQQTLDSTTDTDKDHNGQDIHFETSLQSPGNMYMQIYGVPETWLSLVSQTTRLANVIDRLSPSEKPRDAQILASLQPRAAYLENAICLFQTRHSSPNTTTATGHGETKQQTKPHMFMVQALSSALVIFFFRRVRKINPLLLQNSVNSVISALHAWDDALIRHGLLGPGTAWPAFIAGAEAMAQPQRQQAILWLDNGFSKAGWAGYKTSKEVLLEVWKKRDELQTGVAASTTSIPTWMDICRETGSWPILC